MLYVIRLNVRRLCALPAMQLTGWLQASSRSPQVIILLRKFSLDVLSRLALIGKSGPYVHKSDSSFKNGFDKSVGRYFDSEAEELMYAASHHGRVEIAPARSNNLGPGMN